MITGTKFSKQRTAVLTLLKSRTDHPTADMLYNDLRRELPNISLGTVYRNLALLESNGEIIKITVKDGSDRFDGNPVMHYHMLCECCGAVTDVHMKLFNELNTIAEKTTGAEIIGHSVIFYGKCRQCLEKQKKL